MLDEHRSDLIRLHTPASELRLSRDTDGRTRFEGYAAVFDKPTQINSWEGQFTESFQKGAFRKTLAESGDSVKFLYDHGLDPSIGNKPLGRVDSLREDDYGLKVMATMLDRPYVDDITEALRAEALDGMSFRFSVVRDEWQDKTGDMPRRVVKEAKLHEVSVVTFPAYAATTAGVRGQEAYRIWRTATDTATQSDVEIELPAADTGTGTEAADTGTSGSNSRVDRAEFIEHVRSVTRRSQ